MESLKVDQILLFNPDTLFAVRKKFNLDQPGSMTEAVNILDAWVKKQRHFMKTDFDRHYLETLIIVSKGSLERAKSRLDKMCTLKTLMPKFFTKHNALKDFGYLKDILPCAILPTMTNDYQRLYVVKFSKERLTVDTFFDFYRLNVLMSEYLYAHDYCNGYAAVVDFRDTDMLNVINSLNLVDMRQMMTLMMEAYGLRIKGIHLLTTSNLIDVVINGFKQVVSKKIGDRISSHRTIESLYAVVPREHLPQNLGGDQKSLDILYDDWLKVLSSEKNIEYLKMIKEAATVESKRQAATSNQDYMGIPGSFRNLGVD